MHGVWATHEASIKPQHLSCLSKGLSAELATAGLRMTLATFFVACCILHAVVAPPLPPPDDRHTDSQTWYPMGQLSQQLFEEAQLKRLWKAYENTQQLQANKQRQQQLYQQVQRHCPNTDKTTGKLKPRWG